MCHRENGGRRQRQGGACVDGSVVSAGSGKVAQGGKSSQRDQPVAFDANGIYRCMRLHVGFKMADTL